STGLLTTLTRDGGAAVREIDLDDPFFSALNVQLYSAIDFGELEELLDAAVELRYGDQRKGALLTKEANGPAVFQAAMTRPSEDEYEYSVVYHFKSGVGDGPLEMAGAPVRTRARTLVIDPAAHFRRVRVRARRVNLDFARVPRQIVHLRVPGV